MTRLSGSSWTSDEDKGGYDAPVQTSKDLGSNQKGKPLKTVIGIALLVILALALSRMNPVPHDVSNTPSVTTGADTR